MKSLNILAQKQASCEEKFSNLLLQQDSVISADSDSVIEMTEQTSFVAVDYDDENGDDYAS